MTYLATKLLVLPVLVLLPGCVVGYNSVLFATKSNLGFDFDAAPPTAELAISRAECVIEPTFEGGQTLPVMASFKVKGEGLFAGGVGQTFTTGDAATVMATLYGDDFPKNGEALDWKKDVEEKFDSALILHSKPQLPDDKLSFATTEVKPVFFGTSTSFGLKVSWSGMAGPNPDSLHLGYKRKELAWAPVSMEKVVRADIKSAGSDVAPLDGDSAEPLPATVYRMRVPSLLATVDAAVDVRDPRKAKFDWLQYFATGRSATALSLRKEVRRAMLERLDPAADFSGIPMSTLTVEQAKAPLTKKWHSLDATNPDDARKVEIFDEEARKIPPGFDDFEDFIARADTVPQVQTLRKALEARRTTFDDE